MEDWKRRLEELSFTKGYYFKLGDNGLVEKKDDQLIFNREVLEAFVKQELSKAREEGRREGGQAFLRDTLSYCSFHNGKPRRLGDVEIIARRVI